MVEARHTECIEEKTMSRRAHLVWRLSALLLLAAVVVWPRSREVHRDPAAIGVATPAHLFVTTAARREPEPPRPRVLRPSEAEAAPVEGREGDLRSTDENDENSDQISALTN